MNFWTILIARLLAGFGQGLKGVAVNRMIEEYCPLALYPVASAANGLISQLGSFLALFSAMFQPVPPKPAAINPYYDTEYKIYEEELETDVTWRYIFGFTFILIATGTIGLIFFVRYDTPKFYLS
jgi:MFS family permease